MWVIWKKSASMTAEADFGNFLIEYLGEFEAICMRNSLSPWIRALKRFLYEKTSVENLVTLSH
jgi:hypothetical protein